MKTWKTIGITALVLASLCWSGAAQAKRFSKQHYNQETCQSYGGYNHQPHWRDRGRHLGWERQRGWERHHGSKRHQGWPQAQNEFARSYHR